MLVKRQSGEKAAALGGEARVGDSVEALRQQRGLVHRDRGAEKTRGKPRGLRQCDPASPPAR